MKLIGSYWVKGPVLICIEDSGTSWACKGPDLHLRNKRVSLMQRERERGREGEKVLNLRFEWFGCLDVHMLESK